MTSARTGGQRLAGHHIAWDRTERRREELILPGASGRNWIEFPVETGLYLRGPKYNGRHSWEIAIDVHLRRSPEHTLWHRVIYVRPADWWRSTDDIEDIRSGKNGWRLLEDWRADIDGFIRGKLLRADREQETRRKGVHLLECSHCGEVSDVQARRWRMHLEPTGAVRAICPRCSRRVPLESKPVAVE